MMLEINNNKIIMSRSGGQVKNIEWDVYVYICMMCIFVFFLPPARLLYNQQGRRVLLIIVTETRLT